MQVHSDLPNYNFTGRTIAVTGGASGIGCAIAERFRHFGAEVWSLDKASQSDSPFHLNIDICNAESLKNACDTIMAKSGKLDTLVHCAGFAGPTLPLTDYPADIWRKIVEVNLIGTFEVCRHFVPLLLKSPISWLVNMASLAGKEGTPNASAYSAAKAGVIALTKSLAKEHARDNLRVNCLAPAAVETALLAQMEPEHVATMIGKSPQGRLATVAEVAEITLWLCSAACTFNTGAVFDLSGGRATF